MSHKEDPSHLLGRIAARQFGVFHRSQALGAGFDGSMIKYRLRTGEWERLHPAVYRMRGAPASWEQRLMAAQLWAGDGTAISHRSAAALWKLDGVEPGVVELTTATKRSSVPKGIKLHRTNDLARSDYGYRGPFRITGIVRTLIDLGAVEPDPAVVEAAMECALRRDEALLERLKCRLESLGRHGRRGAGVIREILALRDPDAVPTESMFETLVERVLRRARIQKPVRQHEVYDDEGNLLARIDFFWAGKGPDGKGVGLEPEGERWHDGRARFQRSVDRANALALTHITIVRVTWQDLVRRPDEVVAKLRQAGV